MGLSIEFELIVTTQGPSYPPSEVVDENGDFITIGYLNRDAGNGQIERYWGRAIVSKNSNVPVFGKNAPYHILREWTEGEESSQPDMVLYTLPLPLPCNNYPMIFAPEQVPHSHSVKRPSYPLHLAPIPDFSKDSGRKITQAITYKDWIKAKGYVRVTVSPNQKNTHFALIMSDLVPSSLYTVMSLRENDLNPSVISRPTPLGVPNVFITDRHGNGTYEAELPNPFPTADREGRNRIINIIVLFMSSQMSYGGAIAHYGLGGDIHAHLKLKEPKFSQFETIDPKTT